MMNYKTFLVMHGWQTALAGHFLQQIKLTFNRRADIWDVLVIVSELTSARGSVGRTIMLDFIMRWGQVEGYGYGIGTKLL
jgi:hypothetical protein